MRYLIGIGTYYGRDDAVGLRIAEAIGERGLDHDFRALEIGGNVLDLVHYLRADTERLLVVDSARMGAVPGAYAFFRPDDVVSRKADGGLSTHEGDLLKVLEFARAMDHPLDALTILGIEPADIKAEPGLSTTLSARFDEYVAVAVAFMTTQL